MLDRYSKAVLTVIAASLMVLAADSLSRLLPTARAESNPKQKRCVWTQVIEGGKPSLGENGTVKLGREWQPVSDGGWELKGAVWAVNQGVYLFEKCESQ